MTTELERLIEEFIARALEHCDSVRVFVTKREASKEENQAYTNGGGNFYAQLGQVKEWVVTQDEYVKEHARRQ